MIEILLFGYLHVLVHFDYCTILRQPAYALGTFPVDVFSLSAFVPMKDILPTSVAEEIGIEYAR